MAERHGRSCVHLMFFKRRQFFQRTTHSGGLYARVAETNVFRELTRQQNVPRDTTVDVLVFLVQQSTGTRSPQANLFPAYMSTSRRGISRFHEAPPAPVCEYRFFAVPNDHISCPREDVHRAKEAQRREQWLQLSDTQNTQVSAV